MTLSYIYIHIYICIYYYYVVVVVVVVSSSNSSSNNSSSRVIGIIILEIAVTEAP